MCLFSSFSQGNRALGVLVLIRGMMLLVGTMRSILVLVDLGGFAGFCCGGAPW